MSADAILGLVGGVLAILVTIVGTSWRVGAQVSRIGEQLERVRSDVADLRVIVTGLHEEHGRLRERVAVVESRCAMRHQEV